MIRLSVNVISSAIRLIHYIAEGIAPAYEQAHSLYRIGDIDVDDLIEMLVVCNLIGEGSNKRWIITSNGEYVADEVKRKNYGNAYKRLLENYIVYAAPVWSRRIPYGRQEAAIFMTKDERACFYEASLLNDEPLDDEVLWWDNISASIRHNKIEKNLITGRIGEKLTLSYEEKRTGIKAKWMSVNSNLLGYDILSVDSEINKSPLLIEVKASQSDINEAYCHITSNEWNVSKSVPTYLFYFWMIYKSIKSLAVISKKDLEPHIPENKNGGMWESVKIPFSIFEDKFSEWRN